MSRVKKYMEILLLTANLLVAQIRFVDVADATGTKVQCDVHGSGFFDYDGDGWEDIFVVSNISVGPYTSLKLPHVLLKNLGNGQFTDVAESAGVKGYYYRDNPPSAQGLACGDYDNDGDLDFFIGMGNPSFQLCLYQNKGDNTFHDVSYYVGLDEYTFHGRCFTLLDFDNDGWLDLFFLRDLNESDPPNRLFCLYRNVNQGPYGKFENVSERVGLWNFSPTHQDLYGFAIADADNDGDLDIFVPRLTANSLYLRNDSGRFSEVASQVGLPDSSHYIGAVFLDANNDGWFDLFCKRQNRTPELYENNGNGTFTNVSIQAGFSSLPVDSLPSSTGFGGGLLAEDFDNDGDMDIFLTNAKGQFNRLFLNHGDGTFSDSASSAGLVDDYEYYWSTPTADYNHDGYLDLYMGRADYIPRYAGLYRNAGGENQAIFVKLQGVQSNRSGIGARLVLRAGGKTQLRQVQGGDGYKVNSFWIHFGIGTLPEIDTLMVFWPSGIVQKATYIPAGSRIILLEKDTVEYRGLPAISGKVSHIFSKTPLSNVELTMTGDFTGVDTTDSMGEYRLLIGSYGNKTITITPAKSKEHTLENVITSYDAALILRFIVGLEILSENQLLSADANRDGIIDALDAFYVARYAVGIYSDQASQVGAWGFSPQARLYTQIPHYLEEEDFLGFLIGDVSLNWSLPEAPGKKGIERITILDTLQGLRPQEEVEIPVFFHGDGLIALDVKVQYPSQELSFLDVFSPLVSQGFQSVVHEVPSGRLHVALYRAQPLAMAKKVLVFRFKINSDVHSSIPIRWEKILVNEKTVLQDYQSLLMVYSKDTQNSSKSVSGFLYGNYPNPFNPETRIRYELFNGDRISIFILNLQGRIVRTLLQQREVNSGVHEILWDGKDDQGIALPSGVYIMQLRTRESVFNRKMVKLQ